MAGVDELKERAIEVYYAAQDLVEKGLHELKGRDRYFKYKLGIFATWAALSLGTLGVACPGGGVPGDNNNIGAHIGVESVLDDLSVLVENESTSQWKDVKLTLNGQYMAFTPELDPGAKVVIRGQQFVGPGGKVAPRDIKASTVRIECSRGSYTADLSKPAD
jgi:hypothetical protein